MKLSTRLSVAMVALVLFTAITVFLIIHRDVETSVILAWAIATLVGVGLAVWLSHSLSKSLAQVTAAVQAISRGEDVKVPTFASGEEGLLARTFARMAGEIRTNSAQLREYRRRERCYAAAVESANYAFITVDPEGIITAWNAGAERLFGFSADEAIGQPLAIIIPNDKREEADGNRARIHRGERIVSLETVRIAKDGRRIEVVIDGCPILSRSGNVHGSSIIARDVTSQKLTEEMFRLAVESCPSGMVMVDGANRIVLTNAALERMFGYRRDEMIGESIDLLKIDDFNTDRLRTDKPPSAHNGNDRYGTRKDGTEFPVEISLNAIPMREGQLVLGVVVDITERRRNDRLKDEFVSTVSHELRTPLTSIAGSLGLLAGGAAGSMPEPTMRLLRIAHKNSERLVRLINDILDIEKIESGKVVFDLQRVDVLALIEQAIEANRGFAESYGVAVRLDPGSAPAFVRADPDRLVQVITNLLSNAVKFSPRHQEVVVAIEPRTEIVRIKVRDHGSGIPEDFKPRIFEKFAQADASDARQKGGTGLGLSIVKQIVTLLGGSVGFENNPDGGATFHVDLPRWQLSSGADATAKSSVPLVLVCDDDGDVAKTIASRLEQAGFMSDVAVTARAALAYAQVRRYHALLIDLSLPDRDGISLIQDIRALPQHHNTPIVVISADAARGRDDIRSASLDVLDWLNKPIDIQNLVEVLDRPLARGSGRRPHILHIDDDGSVLQIVAETISQSCNITSVASIDEARAALATRRFDCAVVDLMLSQGSGLDLLPDIRDRDGIAIPVILYSARAANGANSEQVHAALTKSHASIDHLIATLRKHMAANPAPAQPEREVA